MNESVVPVLKDMTGEQIALWCAANQRMVVIEYHIDHQGTVHPIIRAHGEPSLNIDLPALLRRQAE